MGASTTKFHRDDVTAGLSNDRFLPMKSGRIKALVISPEEMGDRPRRLLRQCRRLGIEAERVCGFMPDKAEGYFPSTSHRGGNLGVMASYHLALMRASELDCEWVLVLEDDATFRSCGLRYLILKRHLASLPASVAAVRIGYMNGNEFWWKDIPLKSRARLLLRPRVRLRSILSRLQVRSQPDKTFPPPVVNNYGAMALLVRPVLASSFANALDPANRVVDARISELLEERSPLLRQSRSPWITQPRVPSERLRLNRFG